MEEAIQFSVADKKLFGILNTPDSNKLGDSIVLMVTGGPQTRVGSHRLYVQLSRYLEKQGVASFRFDYEGTGDSEGEWVGYRYAGPSIKAAIRYLKSSIHNYKKIIIWSLCDGATTSILYAAQYPDDVGAMLLCNPYLFNAEGKARTILKYYYINRLFQKDFWKKVFAFHFNFKDSMDSFKKLLRTSNESNDEPDYTLDKNFFGLKYEIPIEEVEEALKQLKTEVTFLLSTNDLTAKQFEDFLKNKNIKHIIKQIKIQFRYIHNADHTFSDSKSKAKVFETSCSIINSMN